jgi:hypothetical protein
MVAALVLIAVLCALTVAGAIGVRRDTVRLRDTVAQRAAAAAQLRFALADLDAQRADTLAPGVSAADPLVLVGNQLNALLTAQQRRAQVSDLLRQLAGDTSQQARVSALLDGLGRYDDLSGRAAYVAERNPNQIVGQPPRVAVSMNVQAGEVMHDELLPAADKLASAYQQQAADRQSTAHDGAIRWALAIGLLGLLALLFLVWWQWQLARDYRRLLTPGLLVATAATLAIGLAGALAFGGTAGSVSSAGKDGLRPWTRLAEARAVAAQAAASESRWFVHGADYGAADTAAFNALIVQLQGLLSPDGYATAAERPGYADVLTRFGHFRADDKRLRELQAQGRTAEAAEVLTSVTRGDVAFDFWDFATTLDALAGRQLDDFTAHAADARSSLDQWPALPAGALGVSAVLVLLAVRPRFAEYR